MYDDGSRHSFVFDAELKLQGWQEMSTEIPWLLKVTKKNDRNRNLVFLINKKLLGLLNPVKITVAIAH